MSTRFSDRLVMAPDREIRPVHIGKRLPPPYAGVEAHIDTLLRALAPDVTGTLIAIGKGAESSRAAALPYRTIVAPMLGAVASTPIAPGVLWHARRELDSGRCNLLHTHGPNPWGDIATIGVRGDTPVVMTWHSDIVRQRRLMLGYRPVQRRAIERADRIIVLTPRHYESSVQLKAPGVEAKLAPIPLGIELSGLQPQLADASTMSRLDAFAAGRPLALTVGRHVYYKGYEHLLAAMAKLRSDTVLAMIGTGPQSLMLHALAGELGLTNRVLFLGEIDHPALVAALHRCDFFCLPSVEPSEAFGIASAEAMACGKATIVCQLHNGVNYLNQDGRTSLTVLPRDVPALADAIDTLAFDNRLRGQLGTAAAQWIRSEFSIERMRERTIALYRSLM